MKLTCINCPMGCSLTVEEKGGEIVVTGNTCKRGEIYGKQEFTLPMRTVTSLVGLDGGGVLSVKTSAPVPKNRIFDVLKIISGAKAAKPVEIGDVIVKNALGLGVDIIATQKVP